MPFWKKKEKPIRSWDREETFPAVRCSICTGEQVFGFRDVHSDEFHEVAMIRSDAELLQIAREYGITDLGDIRRFY